ncbi:MAG: hypothetical protein LBE12_20910 [Planctomycetaceae bacterium]|nr:hypothetical protein [Planctomycetaceae bacterium]
MNTTILYEPVRLFRLIYLRPPNISVSNSIPKLIFTMPDFRTHSSFFSSDFSSSFAGFFGSHVIIPLVENEN